MDNPVLHGPLGNPISPERMHKEIHAERHSHCTPQTCEMLRSCRNVLTTLGHDPDAEASANCPACQERAQSASIRTQESPPVPEFGFRLNPTEDVAAEHIGKTRVNPSEPTMTPALPQRIPGARAAPAALCDPSWYAAIVRTLRDIPAERFPCSTDTAAHPEEHSHAVGEQVGPVRRITP